MDKEEATRTVKGAIMLVIAMVAEGLPKEAFKDAMEVVAEAAASRIVEER